VSEVDRVECIWIADTHRQGRTQYIVLFNAFLNVLNATFVLSKVHEAIP